jgi:hypothetical protein
MASWDFGVGSLVSRAAAEPVPVAPATEDAELPLANLGSDYPDEEGSLAWRADGAYAIDFDLNLLALSSARSDAPTGWADLLNLLAGTPGLPANPPDWGTYGARNPALRLFRPVVQLLDVMPGEAVKLSCSIQWPAAAVGATGIRVRVVDSWSGKGWDGAAWADGGVLESQLVADAWKDVVDQIDADPARTERSTYSVILEPIAATFDATTYCYASAAGAAGSPAFFAEVDAVAIIGHNLPADADVTLVPQPAGTTLTLVPAQPSMYVVGAAAQLVQVWRLVIQMPTGNQPRPILGEVWIGVARTWLVGSPVPTFSGRESTPGQISVEAGKRREVVADEARPVQELSLAFRAPDGVSFRQIRDEIMRLTRFGAEPIVLFPQAEFDGAGRVYHGRVADELSWSIITPTATGDARSFGMPFTESPFAGPRA